MKVWPKVQTLVEVVIDDLGVKIDKQILTR